MCVTGPVIRTSNCGVSATLTFTTASGGFTQTVQIPVSLIKGDIYQATYTGPQPPPLLQFLPLIRR